MEGRHGPTAGASVVLDIGPHAGALVVYTDRQLAGEEIEIRRYGGRWHGAHTEVRARHIQDGVVHAGLFGSLSPGRYDLRLRPGHGEHITVEVTAAAVTEAFFPRPRTVGEPGGAEAPNSTPANAPVSL